MLPVAPVAERAGTFVNWEGRERPFDAVLDVPAAMPDVRVLAALADELGTPLGFADAAAAKAELDELAAAGTATGPSRAGRTAAKPDRPGACDSTRLATWRLLIDDSRATTVSRT